MRKKLLSEAQVRRFQSLASIKPLNEMDSSYKMHDDEDEAAMKDDMMEAEDEEMDEALYEEEEEEMDMDKEEESVIPMEASDEEVEEATDEVEESTEGKSNAEIMREYTNKVTAKMGDNGANTKSPVASANDMGGSAGNIAQGADEKGGSADKPKEDTAGNVNVPGGSASKSMKAQPGHGAEKKSKPENADNKKAVIGN